MNLGAMVQKILEDTHSLVSSDQIRRKIIQALKFHRDKHYFWNEKDLALTLTVGVRDYTEANGLPSDFAQVFGDVLYLREAGYTTSRELVRVDNNTMGFFRTGNTQQSPVYWDVWKDNTLRFDAIANSASLVTGRYVSDIEVPQAKWNTVAAPDAWSFFRADGTTALTDAFTNSWFEDERGADAIEHRTMYTLYKSTLSDPEQANYHLEQWLEIVGQLETITEQRSGGPMKVVPQILDEWL